MNDAAQPACRVLALHLTKPSNSEANVLARLLRNLDPRIAVDLVINSAGDDDAASHLHPLAALDNVTVHTLDVGLPIDPWMPPSRVRRLLARAPHPVRRHRVLELATTHKVDLVYTGQQRFDCALGEWVATKLGVPQVVHLHFNIWPWLRRRTRRRLVTTDHVIAISSFIGAQALAEGVRPERLTVVPNSLELPPEPVRPGQSAPVIGQIGRFDIEKGFLDTVEVYRRLLERHPDVRLLLVGDGPLREEVAAAVAALPAGANVELVGWQENIEGWLARIDAFLHPSRREPFGLAVLEAMAAGIPVVAYGDGGVAEIIENGVSGFLHEPGDVSGLTASTERLVGDRELRRDMGIAARARVADAFDPASAGAAFSKVLFDVAGAAAGRDRAPAVGIVIPNFNKAEFVVETLRSALAQTHPGVEVVVVDDGSTDDSVAVIRAALDGARGRVVEVPNGGVANARNTGFRALSEATEYVLFLDSDDVLEPHAVAQLVAHLERYPDTVAAYSTYTPIDAGGAVLDGHVPDARRWVPRWLGRRALPDTALVTPLESVYSRFQMLPSGTMIRRSAFERTAGWDPALCRPARPFHAEDKDMAVQLALLGEVHRLDQRLFRYRILPTAHRATMYEGLRELDRKWWNAALTGRARRRVRRAIRFDRKVSMLDAGGACWAAIRRREGDVQATCRDAVGRAASWLVAPVRLRRAGQPPGSSGSPDQLRG